MNAAMVDRQLLELAAKAAGHKWGKSIAEDRAANGSISLWLLPEDGSLGCTAWNPLENDGHALWLAVKLQMGILVDERTKKCAAAVDEGNYLFEPMGSDPYAATRRVIVRAAAAIGGAA